MRQATAQRPELTFKANLQQGRHGWLRLTPAFSAQMVQIALERTDKSSLALDPFAGTGTTGLVCAAHGIPCDLLEVNPFLVWLSRAKTREYTEADLRAARDLAYHATRFARNLITSDSLWFPPIHRIERWWSPSRRRLLAALHAALRTGFSCPEPALHLNLIAFCRVAIEWSGAAFNHQSMSFKSNIPSLFENDEMELILEHFIQEIEQIVDSARASVGAPVRVVEGDARRLHEFLPSGYDLVITSPPYPNRISYVRELRPYMYWLGYLKESRDAGELDWRAIGGTWGVATSRLLQWQPTDSSLCQYAQLVEIASRIARRSTILANYVLRYFEDMKTHILNLTPVLQPRASIFYVVGNAKFYDVIVPTHEILASFMREAGFEQVTFEPIRKRNSKKELYEYLVLDHRVL